MARPKYDSLEVKWSKGTGNNLGKAKNQKSTWARFKEHFRKPLVTNEKFHQYKKASDAEQRRLKAINGWFMRAAIAKGQNRNRNSILPGRAVTMDFDYLLPEFAEQIINGQRLKGVVMFAHSSRSHTPEEPRLRVVVLCDREVDREEYQAVSRILAQKMDPTMEHIDKVTFRPAQMMFMPTCSRDMEQHYVFYEQDGEPLDVDEMIDDWEMINSADASDISQLPRAAGEDELRQTAEKAEDPLLKNGPVGDFCRAWSVTELVEGKDGVPGPLADIYQPVEYAQGAISRMTYMHGSTSNGAVVYEDKFIFSHHGSDPTQEQLVNAYDAVRLHKFADQDADADKDTPVSKLPSAKAMMEFMRGDKFFKEQQAESRYELDNMLTDDDVDYPDDEVHDDDEDEESADDLLGVPMASVNGYAAYTPSVVRRKADKPPKKWIAKQLELTDDGIIKTTMHNIGTICMNDPRLWRKIAYNAFNYQIVMTADVKSKTKLIPAITVKDRENGDRWQEINDIVIRAIIEGPTNGGVGYGIKVGKEMVHDAVKLAARANEFHPVREYLEHCESKHPEASPRLIEELFTEYFGAEDNAYNRQIGRLIMIASVARVMEPGCKFDYAPILEGPQGIGKSTAIMRLYGKQYFSEIDGDLSNRKYVAEQMTGAWCLELPELSSLNKTESNDAKAFMTRTKDDVRLSYDRNVSELPRQSVIWGTTNDEKYLRDATGGRRYWTVLLTHVEAIDSLAIMRDRDLLWASAVAAYKQMRKENPNYERDLPLYLTGEALEHAEMLQEAARKKEPWENWMTAVLDWMDEEHSLQGLSTEFNADIDFEDDTHFRGHHLESTVCRVAFTQKMVFDEAFNFHGNLPSGAQPDQLWNKVMEELRKAKWETKKCRIGGKQARWVIRPDITQDERQQGFRVLKSAQAPGIVIPSVSDDHSDSDEGDSLI